MSDDIELGPDGKEWAKTLAGYAHVKSMIPRAERAYAPDRVWRGWALREAFVAGAEWQEKREKKNKVEEEKEEPQEPLIRIPIVTDDIKIGDSVFACRWSDADPGDPWVIGHVSKVLTSDVPGEWGAVVVGDSPQPERAFPRAVKITKEHAHRLLELYPSMATHPTNYEWIASVWEGQLEK